jgi:hypothetical protein
VHTRRTTEFARTFGAAIMKGAVHSARSYLDR